MPLTFVGSQYVNSKPINPQGLKFLSSNFDITEYSIIDLGNFSYKYSNNKTQKEDLINYFLTNYKDSSNNFFTIDNLLFGKDALSLASLQKQTPLRLIKNNSLIAYQNEQIDTHKVLLGILEKTISKKKIIISDQNDLIINFFKKNFDEIQIVDKTLVIYNQYKKQLHGSVLVIDVGFNQTSFLFKTSNLFFEKKEIPFGVEFFHNLIQSSSDYKNYDILQKELNQFNLQDLSEQSFNCLYDFGLEQFLSKVINQYLDVLNQSQLIKFLKKEPLNIIVSGSLFTNETISSRTTEIIKKLVSELGETNIIINNNKHIFIDGIYGN